MIDGPERDGSPGPRRSRLRGIAAHLGGRVGRWARELAVYKAVPLSICAALFGVGAPWEAVLLMMVAAPYWYGPVIVYLTQRMPVTPALRVADEATAPHAAHRGILEATLPALRQLGFVPLGRFTSCDQQRALDGTVVLLQHREASDLAHVVVATQAGHPGAGHTLVFTRDRSDGGRIATVRQSIASPFPPSRGDSVLRVDGRVEVADLWAVHRQRVVTDPTAKRNDPVSDAYHYQLSLERDAARRHVASGLWQADVSPALLRPTARGAVLMCLRMLAPWKQASRIRGRLQARRLRRQAGRVAAPHAA